jgi:hypothetical protein
LSEDKSTTRRVYRYNMPRRQSKYTNEEMAEIRTPTNAPPPPTTQTKTQGEA